MVIILISDNLCSTR